jgi:hypothetical protein
MITRVSMSAQSTPIESAGVSIKPNAFEWLSSACCVLAARIANKLEPLPCPQACQPTGWAAVKHSEQHKPRPRCTCLHYLPVPPTNTALSLPHTYPYAAAVSGADFLQSYRLAPTVGLKHNYIKQ